MKILTVYTLNSHLLTIKAHITEKSYAFVVCWNIWSLFEKNCRSRSDCSGISGFTLFALIIMLTNKQTFSDVDILLAFYGLNHTFWVLTVFPEVLWYNFKIKLCLIFRQSLILSLKLKSWLDLCMEQSTCHETVIHLSQRFTDIQNALRCD